MKEYTPIVRVRLDSVPVLPLEPTEQVVWLSRSCRCLRYGLLGVPCCRIDVLVDECLDDIDEYHRIVCAVGAKRGRYDGAERVRLTLRVEHRTSADALPLAVIDVEQREGTIDLDLRGLDGGLLWGDAYQQLRTEINDYDPVRLVAWHWTRYYRNIPHEDALALAESWTIPSDCTTLAAANRAASRALYRLARDLGWRKLTMRERGRLGLDGGQWVREEVYAAAQERLGNPTGCGEATLRAASGGGDFLRLLE